MNKNTKEELDPDEHLERCAPPPWNCLMARRRFLENMQLKMFKEKSNDPLHTKPSVLGVFIRILRSRSIRCMDNILWACKPIGRAIVWRAPDARNATSYRVHQSFPKSTNINLLFSVCHLTIHQTQKKTHQDHRQFPLGYSPPAD